MTGPAHATLFLLHLGWIISLGLGGIQGQSPAAETAPFPATPWETSGSEHKSVIIDPGHGGDDAGVQLGGGETEKTLTLAMGKVLQRQLRGKFPVGLTRTDDVTLTVMARSARANQARGDLLISVHIADHSAISPVPAVTVFHSQTRDRSPPNLSQGQYSPAARPLTPWFQAQQPHLAESRRLAQLLVQRLSADLPHWVTHLTSAPIAVLDGARMPAVLMEIYPPQSPQGSELDAASPWLEKLARSVAITIETLWRRGENGPIVEDLHE